MVMSASDAPQNVYDDKRFFDGYSGMERFGADWGVALEHPYFLALLPPLDGRRVLDLGCGAGQLAFHLAQAGAAEVVGVDLSEQMLAVARARRSHPRVTYQRGAMEEIDFPAGRFDLVVSSLALHYVRDYAGLVRRVATWLSPGGAFVFSTEHPIYTARASDDGWVLDAAGRRIAWGVDRYPDDGERVHHWFVEGVRRQHRTMGTLINGLVDAGLAIERVVEPVPDERWVAERPRDADEQRRPMFFLVAARKR